MQMPFENIQNKTVYKHYGYNKIDFYFLSFVLSFYLKKVLVLKQKRGNKSERELVL